MYVRSDGIVEDSIYTCQRGIMLDPVVQIQLVQVERIFAITFFQHVRGIVWNKKAQGRRNVARCPNQFTKLFEGDISTVMGQNAWIGCEQSQNIKHSNLRMAIYRGLPSHSMPGMGTYCLPLLVEYTLATLHLYQDGPPAPHALLCSLASTGYIEWGKRPKWERQQFELLSRWEWRGTLRISKRVGEKGGLHLFL